MMRKALLAVLGAVSLLAACSETEVPVQTGPAAITATSPSIEETTATTRATTPPPETASTASSPAPATTAATTTTATPMTSPRTNVRMLSDDLFCRDLHELGYAYPETALYWSVFDRPERMDADGNGIPCETVYSADDVEAFWGPPATPGAGTIAEVAAWVQRWYDDAYQSNENVPEEVVGPLQIRCRDSGPVERDDIIVCRGVPQTERPESLETATLLILVLDPSGTAIWSAGTDLSPDIAGLRYQYHLAPKGLSCEDLLAPNIRADPFNGSSRPPDDAFFYSMVYWSLEGEPAHMDADGDGIPCEELYSADRLESILEGGPVPLYIRD